MIRTIIIIASIVVFLVLIYLLREYIYDMDELKQQPIEEKFATVMSTINQGLFDGDGTLSVNEAKPREAFMTEDIKGDRTVIYQYNRGALIIKLLYKGKTFKRRFYHLRNESIMKKQECGLVFVKDAQAWIATLARNKE